MDWTVESIPDEDHLYRRVHRVHMSRGEVEPTAFKNYPAGSESMSVDWARYSTPEETHARASKPAVNAVLRLITGEVRALTQQKVEHWPQEGNRSHSEVIGKKSNKLRLILARICTVVIPLEHNPQETQPSSR